MHFVSMKRILLHSDWQVCVFYSLRSCFFLKVNTLLHECRTNSIFCGRICKKIFRYWVAYRGAGSGLQDGTLVPP